MLAFESSNFRLTQTRPPLTPYHRARAQRRAQKAGVNEQEEQREKSNRRPRRVWRGCFLSVRWVFVDDPLLESQCRRPALPARHQS